MYNIYDVCNGDDSTAGAPVAGDSSGASSRHARIRAAQRNRDQLRLSRPAESYSPHPQLRGALNDFACGGEPMMQKWLSRADVMKALHVDADTGGMRYNANVGDITALYQRLVKKYRVLIYSGDVDGCAYWGKSASLPPSEGTQRKLGMPGGPTLLRTRAVLLPATPRPTRSSIS